MADKMNLNPGVGGEELRTLRHADGSVTALGAIAYATTLSDGANVTQIVDSAHGLPVAFSGDVDVVQANEQALNATVFQGGSWVTQLAPGQTVGISGTVPVSFSNPVSIASGQSVGIDGPVSISGTVPVSIGSPVSLAGGTEVEIASGQSVGIVGKVTVEQDGPIAISGTVPISVSAPITIEQPIASNLKTQATLTAGTELIGKASAGVDGATIYSGTSALTPKFAKIDAGSSGDNAIVAAVSGRKIRVLRWGLTAEGDVSAKWRSGSTDLTGPRKLMEFASAGGAYTPVGIFETAAGQALNLNLSDAVQVGGEITYVEVPA